MTSLWNAVAGTIAGPLGFVLLLPLVTIVVLGFVWTARIVWWEYLLVFAVPLVFVLIVRGVSVASQTHDVEWVRLRATEGWYEEAWNRYVHRTCSSGSGTKRRTWNCSYVETIPPRWWIKLSDGTTQSVGPTDFQDLRARWGGAAFVEMHRLSYTMDGDAWKTIWNGDSASLQPWTVERSWENRIHAARSVFGYGPVDTSMRRRLGLVDYPGIEGRKAPQVLGVADPRADEALRRANAKAPHGGDGPSLFLVVFEGKPPSAGRAQEALWEGGNRNEFVVTLGRDKGRTTWVRAFTWTPDRKLAIEVRDVLLDHDSLTLAAIADTVAARVIPRWKQRDFHEFDYLRVQPTPRAILLALFLSLGSSVAIGFWSVKNQHTVAGLAEPRWIPRPGRRFGA